MVEQKNEVDFAQIYERTKQRIQYLSTKQRVSEREVYHVIQMFFREMLQLNYEFSHEELIDELERTYIDKTVRNRISGLLRNIGQIEYTEKVFSQHELFKMLTEFSHLVEHLIHESKKHKNPLYTLLNKIAHKQVNEVQLEMGHQPEHSISELIMMVKKERDASRAKELYKTAYERYEILPANEQEKTYGLLMDAYEHLKLL